ncbi:solute carrier family 28 member 3 isoform X1 [Drosophila innubila]|uniref:solute carrier family 28 member 3 isoform X1 n=1 Tax=Drosophila innubila TaxID=198719 RepID=UPI00148D4C29|nr:solute carrier family 28 member 3 isoform X1 [Drosophila innubila]
MAEAPSSDGAEDKKESRTKKIIKLVLHILFHILLIAYFIWITIVFVRFDKNGSECNEPEKDDTTAQPTAQTKADENTEVKTTAVSGVTTTTTTTEAPSKETVWRPHILCELNWCIGYGFFVIMFVTFYLFWIYYWLFKPYVGQKLYDDKIEPVIDKWLIFSRKTVISIIMLVIVILLVGAYLGFECRDDVKKLIGISGPVLFLLLGFAISKKRSAIPWRIVVHGLLGQLILGILCIRLQVGRDIFNCAGEKVSRFLRFTDYGARFVYGDRICDEYVFAFAILAVIFFFSVATSILYYLGAMQFFLGAFGFLLQSTVGTTVCESVNACGNVFLGMSESPLMVRPYIELLTNSELHCICTSGFATVAGTVLGAYISFGASPAYLITASVMAAPGGLAIAKLFYPETEESKTKADNIQLERSTDKSLMDAISTGAANALMIVLGIVSNIIAFLALIYFFNAVTEWCFELAGRNGVTFTYLLTLIFIPVVFVMGVPTYDCENIARVVAEKTFINEFVGYRSLGELIVGNKIDERSAGIATFALCGFANPGSLGIIIASLSAMAPSRRSDIANVAVRALVAGTVVSFISASFAGILIQESELKQLGQKFLYIMDVDDVSVGQYMYNV